MTATPLYTGLHDSRQSPFEKANIISRVGYFWISELIQLGSQRPLEQDDIYPLPAEFRSRTILGSINQSWQLEKQRNRENAKLFRSLWNSFKRGYLFSVLSMIPYVAIVLLQPFFVRHILEYVTTGQTYFLGIHSGMGLAVLLGCLSLLSIISFSHSFYFLSCSGFGCRGATISMVFNKSLRLSAAARGKHTIGEIVTLMSTDSERIWQAVLFSNWLWAGPVMVVTAMALLVYEVGPSAVAAVGTMFLINAIQARMGDRVGVARRSMVKHTEERAKVTNEMLQGVRVIKFYAWEKPMEDKVNKIREAEVDELSTYQNLKAVNTSAMFLGPLLVSFALFISFTATHGQLTISKVYTAYALLNIIRLPIALTPQAWAASAEAFVSLDRLTKFLLLEEVETLPRILDKTCVPGTTTAVSSGTAVTAGASGTAVTAVSSGTAVTAGASVTPPCAPSEDSKVNLIDIRDADFRWGSPEECMNTKNKPEIREDVINEKAGDSTVANTATGKDDATSTKSPEKQYFDILTNVNITIRKGEFVAVVGSVGSGKSSLIAAMLGQMHRSRGVQALNAKVAYVGQEHWIQNRTLQENVTFGNEMDDELYADVLDASQLSRDLLVLPHADATSIGERGINLSGGQKARVSITRALYSQDADLYIFDDSLASVDVHVGSAIFEKAIKERLNSRARIVVLSSNYHLLSQFSRILVIADGRIATDGSYADVIQQFPQYATVDGGDYAKEKEQAQTQVGLTGKVDSVFTAVDHEVGAMIGVTEEAEAESDSIFIDSLHHLESSAESNGLKKCNVAAAQSIDSAAMGTAYDSREDTTNADSAAAVATLTIPTPTIATHTTATAITSANTSINTSSTNTNISTNTNTRASEYRDNLAVIMVKRQQSLAIMSEEDRERGAVSVMTYFNYFAAAYAGVHKNRRGAVALVTVILLFTISQFTRVVADIWVGIWARHVQQDENLPASEQHAMNTLYLKGYVVLVGITTVLVCIRSAYFVSICISASRLLHYNLLQAVLAAPINNYFDVTPMGRILNRFSKDLDSMDSLLPDFFLQNLQNGFYCFFIILVCIASTPYFLILLVPIGALFMIVQGYFRKSSREMKRLDGVSRSPMYSLFSEVLQGLTPIRAFGQSSDFQAQFYDLADTQAKMFFAFWFANRWLAIRLDFVANCIIFAVGVLAVGISDAGGIVNPNFLGLALVYALQLTGLLQWTVRVVTETENNMTSVERLLSFLSIPPEEPGLHSAEGTALVAGVALLAEGGVKMDSKQEEKMLQDVATVERRWPSKGSIQIENLQLRYRAGLDLVIKDLSLCIPGGTKVGVCGRTGAGKSSLMLALFRIVEPEPGSAIIIDGVDTQSLPLNTLRTALTIIPQDPVMFSGTLRSNLDPFVAYSDTLIWEALERAHLKEDIVSKFPDQLQHEVMEQGSNLSVGQRQLICIARALLRCSKVIVMDEATASVDTTTDQKIQTTIRNEFKDCTVLTIAHRLETIADYDLIVVMDDGKIGEVGSPFELLQLTSPETHSDTDTPTPTPTATTVSTNGGSVRGAGLFRSLIDELGADRRATILDIAKNRFQQRSPSARA